MAWFRNNRLWLLLECWVRPLLSLGAGWWRWIMGVCWALARPVLSAIGSKKDTERRRPVEGEFSDDEDTHVERARPEEPTAPTQADCEVAWTAERAKRPREHARPAHEEEEDDEDAYRADPADDFYCEYDSTWENDDGTQRDDFGVRRPSGSTSQYKFSRFEIAARDMQNYRHDYPYQSRHQHWRTPVSEAKPNLNFYLGSLPSQPDELYISNFHNDWFGDYEALEHVHTYIQWLFPLQEPGVNFQASPLTKEEIMIFRENGTAKKNLLKSYKLMLDFYGIELCDVKTGDVKKAQNWKERFHNLDTHTHNNLRITRILKCLGTLGYPHYQAPLVQFFLEETLVHQQLPNVRDSVLNYFVFAVLDKKQRRKLIKFAYKNYDHKDEFVWCPRNIRMKWARSIYV